MSELPPEDDVPVGRRLSRGLINLNHAMNLLGLEGPERSLLHDVMRRDGARPAAFVEAEEVRKAVWRLIATTRDEGLRARLREGLTAIKAEMDEQAADERRP